MDRRTDRPKGFGFVTYQSDVEAQKALKVMNGRVISSLYGKNKTQFTNTYFFRLKWLIHSYQKCSYAVKLNYVNLFVFQFNIEISQIELIEMLWTAVCQEFLVFYP